MVSKIREVKPPDLMSGEEARVALEALAEARTRLETGETSAICILELNRDMPRISYAGISRDSLRFAGLLDHMQRTCRDFTEEMYDE